MTRALFWQLCGLPFERCPRLLFFVRRACLLLFACFLDVVVCLGRRLSVMFGRRHQRILFSARAFSFLDTPARQTLMSQPTAAAAAANLEGVLLGGGTAGYGFRRRPPPPTFSGGCKTEEAAAFGRRRRPLL